MKYFEIKIRGFYANEMIASDANGDKVSDAALYFQAISEGKVLKDAPIFDYFFLESYDRKKNWEWKLLDVHGLIREASRISGWLISDDLKLLLENFNLPISCHLYPSKLLYKKNKLDYFILRFSGRTTFQQSLLRYIDYSRTIFRNPKNAENIIIHGANDFLPTYTRVYDENESLDLAMQNKRLVLNEALDFFPMQNFLGQNIVSEKLKEAIETMGITGFEFSELDYEVVIEG
jgi:hypothetical protein